MSAQLVLSIAAILIAASALAVSIMSLRLQYRTRTQQRGTQVDVRVVEHSLQSSGATQSYVHDRRFPPASLTYSVKVVAHNDGERPETIHQLGVWDTRRRQGQLDGVGEPLPPGGTVERTLQLDYELLNLSSDGFVAVAELGSGSEVCSQVERLSDDLLEDLARNARERQTFTE